jgi:hypothetical protein
MDQSNSSSTSRAESAELSNEVIARSKRILGLVDDFVAIPSAANRTILRRALFAEFRAAALRDQSVPATDLPL